MLHIPIRLVFATVVSILVLFFPHISHAERTLAEMAAGLTIDETLEMEKQETSPEKKLTNLAPSPEEPEKPKSALLKPRKHRPNTAAPAQRLPLYMYRSFGNNYNDKAKEKQEKNPAKPETLHVPTTPYPPNHPSPAEQAVTKDYQDIKGLEPATGTPDMQPDTPVPLKSEQPPAQPASSPAGATNPAATTPTQPAPEMDEKEKAMRETIEAVAKKQGVKHEEDKPKATPAVQTQASPVPDKSFVTRIGSVPSMEQDVDYVSVLEKSLLLDPQPLPMKLPFYDENGNEVTLKQFKGKLVLLNFWATWCTPCAMEMPSLSALQENFNDKELPIKVVALSEDFKDVSAIRAFYNQNHIEFLDVYQDKRNAFFREVGIISLPTTMLIDQQGNEILRMSGYIDWNKPEVQEFVRGFLSQ